VQALNDLLLFCTGDDEIKFKLCEYRTIVLPNITRVVFLVIIEYSDHDEHTYISGSSVSKVEHLEITAEATTSVARATLAAVNRKLTKVITP
jgi:hypothetical protein